MTQPPIPSTKHMAITMPVLRDKNGERFEQAIQLEAFVVR